MPIFDYKCNDCQQVYDVFHKVREVEEDIVCPSCNSQRHTRLLSAPNVSVKGKQTDYSAAPSCDTGGGCCGGGMCGIN